MTLDLKSSLESLNEALNLQRESLTEQTAKLQKTSEAVASSIDESIAVVEELFRWLHEAWSHYSTLLPDTVENSLEEITDSIGEGFSNFDEFAKGVLVDEQEERVDHLKSAIGEIASNGYADVVDRLDSWDQEVVDLIKVRISEFQESVASNFDDRLAQLFGEIEDAVLEKVRQELISSVQLTAIQANLSGILSAYYPQLVAIRAGAEVVRQAMEIQRGGM